MRQTTFGAALAAALLTVGLASTASAGEIIKKPVLSVDAATACGRVTLTATVLGIAHPDTGEFPTYELAVYSGPNAGDTKSDALGQFRVSAKEAVTRTFTLDEDAYNGDGFVSWATISGPERDNYVSGAVGVDTNCGDPDTDPAPEPEPTEEPEPTTPAPPPPADEVDCVDFANQAAAQAKLDEDKSDPHNLDLDGDGVACEVEEPAPPVQVDNDVDVDIHTPPQFERVPDTSNGVATGDGSLA